VFVSQKQIDSRNSLPKNKKNMMIMILFSFDQHMMP